MKIEVGMKLKFDGEVQRYQVMAFDERYIIAVKPFNVRNSYLYTIIDLFEGIRGPCDLIFGPEYPFDTREGALLNLEMLKQGKQSVSRRRHKLLTPDELAMLKGIAATA